MIYSLVDFGSTFTKVTLVDADGNLLATAQHPTTIGTDVIEGYERAAAAAADQAGIAVSTVDRIVAASSAAGGLRMAAVGLVDDLTASAAHRAALSAGARVEAVWSGKFEAAEQQALARLAPDVVLFAGGTDGGQRTRVLDNARAVAATGCASDVVVACNSDIADEVRDIFARGGHHAVAVANVLPTVDRERPGPVRQVVRKLFIERVVRAKGISSANEFLDGVVMPTPAAVLACTELLAGEPANRAVLVVDVGGATTDVHSVLATGPEPVRTRRSGPPPTQSLRTVEGDLGVRWNADAVCDLDAGHFAQTLGPDTVAHSVQLRRSDPGYIPAEAAERAFDRMLAVACISIGLKRHVGRLTTRYINGQGAEPVLSGRDLREADLVLLTGGSIVRSGFDGSALAEEAFARLDAATPVPRSAPVVIDENYLLAAIGLLSTVDRDAALHLAHGHVPGLSLAIAPRSSATRRTTVGKAFP